MIADLGSVRGQWGCDGYGGMTQGPQGNNLRIYVVAAATRAVYPLPPLVRSGTPVPFPG